LELPALSYHPTQTISWSDSKAEEPQATLFALEQVAPRATVLHLESGQEALEFLFGTGEFRGRDAGQPGLVLLTLELHGISGLCVLDFMRAHPSTDHVPVVLIGLEWDVRKIPAT
jgi:two-component system, response regulator